jgi:hypothetical protein
MTDEQFRDLFLALERFVAKRLDATDARITAVETGLDAKITAVETRLDAKIEKAETNLLTEFQKWASPMEARVRAHTAVLRALDLEMEALSNRVEKLEGGPAAAS